MRTGNEPRLHLRTGDTTGALTVNFSVGGTATFNTDYTQTGAATFTATDGTVTFADGNATAAVTVDPSADVTAEPDETVIYLYCGHRLQHRHARHGHGNH